MATGFVTDYVNSATRLLGVVNETAFTSITTGINAAAMAAATMAFLLAIFNQFFQLSYISPGKILALLLKTLLISYIGLKWNNFHAIAQTIQDGMDSIANSLLNAISTDMKGSSTLTGSIDSMMSQIATASDKALTHTAWYTGAILTMLIVGCLILLAASASLLIIYSKLMISLFIIIAPIFICCLIFEKTSDYFYRWLQGAITYAMYPIITSAIMAMILGVTNTYLQGINQKEISSIEEFTPFLSLAVIAIVLILFIPVIVSGLSGMIQHVSPIHIADKLYQLKPKAEKNNNNDNNNDNNNNGTNNQNQIAPNKSPGTFPGDPSRLLAREIRIHGDKSKPKQ